MRFLNMLYANAFGYFWLPCPNCKRMYGGHEILNIQSKCKLVNGHAMCVCPKCNDNPDVKDEMPLPVWDLNKLQKGSL